MIGSKEKAATDGYDLREIAIDLIEEVLAEGRDARDGIIDEWETPRRASWRFGEGHDPKILARLNHLNRRSA